MISPYRNAFIRTCNSHPIFTHIRNASAGFVRHFKKWRWCCQVMRVMMTCHLLMWKDGANLAKREWEYPQTLFSEVHQQQTRPKNEFSNHPALKSASVPPVSSLTVSSSSLWTSPCLSSTAVALQSPSPPSSPFGISTITSSSSSLYDISSSLSSAGSPIFALRPF